MAFRVVAGTRAAAEVAAPMRKEQEVFSSKRGLMFAEEMEASRNQDLDIAFLCQSGTGV